jgi:hypothetical protein
VDNGVGYNNRIIREEKRTGVLLGADAFLLADGPLEEASANAS